MAELSITASRSGARLVRAYCLIAGLLDAATGVVLVAAPRVALSAMGVEQVPHDLVLLRWIGAFVGSVGLCYLYPLVLGRQARDHRLAVVLELTVIPRLAVFAFTTGALATGELSLHWVSVPFTDLALAVFQLWMIRSGWLA